MTAQVGKPIVDTNLEKPQAAAAAAATEQQKKKKTKKTTTTTQQLLQLLLLRRDAAQIDQKRLASLTKLRRVAKAC